MSIIPTVQPDHVQTGVRKRGKLQLIVSENNAIQIINAIWDKLGIVADFTNSNIVPYAEDLLRRYVQYVVLNNIIFIVLYSIVICTFYKLTMKFKNKGKSDNNDTWYMVFKIITIALGIGVIFAVPFIISDITKALCIPEALILDLLNKIQEGEYA